MLRRSSNVKSLSVSSQLMGRLLRIQCETELNNHPRKNNAAIPLRVSSKDIMRENGRLIIEHNGNDYILRVTRNGKLILTKRN